jgi:hypothetical protein
MRWFVGAVVALFFIWAGYMASPYFAMWKLASAIDTGDVAALTERVNLYAVRVSLVRQIAAEEIKATGRPTQSVGAAEQQLSAGAVMLLANPVIQSILTSETLFDMVRRALVARQNAGEPAPDEAVTGKAARLQVSHITQIIGASRWRGFRNVYFTLPANAAPDRRYRLQLRFSRMTWRVVALDLPPGLTGRLARDLAARMKANSP